MTTENIDSSNPLPLYFQVYQSLLERIQRGEFPPGSFLPPERPILPSAQALTYPQGKDARLLLSAIPSIIPICSRF